MGFDRQSKPDEGRIVTRLWHLMLAVALVGLGVYAGLWALVIYATPFFFPHKGF